MSALIQALHQRAAVNACVRSFFTARQVLEVETPILSMAGNTEPNIDSFHTQFSGHSDAGPRQRWLRTSPEFPLKRLLAAGVGDCYELGRVFRNGEAGGRHNPEFTLLEWYRVGWDHHRLMQETAALVNAALALVGRHAALQVVDYCSLYLHELGIDPFSASLTELQAALGEVDIQAEGLERDDWLDLLMTHRIQPFFDPAVMTVVHDWPASQAALARIRPGDPPVAERFELYLGPVELANGYHELGDAQEQRARFWPTTLAELRVGSPCPPLDEALLQALPAMPACAGVAVGMDRLLMAMTGTAHIADVLAFDFAHA